ncbi:uncharacterized protein LOC142975316 [Anticarsia gemmatalis]|uniref:uncharacterized protein LOC142975316 n=1 Tax=Anticarsia gemmatalis TaxID=129554 RepID=UPI003F76E6A1
MLKPWNSSTILPPPVNMFLCATKIDIPLLKHVCNNIFKVLSKQSPLHKESALCSRFLYKYDRKFRNDIGYRNFKKVHTALKKYLTLNFLKDVENFLLALPSETEDEKYLPTRQMLEYVLLRMITFSMIMLRICVCSKQASIFYLNRIKRGESHWMSLLPYGLLSRLWSMTSVLVQHSTTWYSNLYPYLSKLELKGLPFLPDNYELPVDLGEWLDLKNIDNFGRFDWDQKHLTDTENGLLDDDENDLLDNILSFVNETNKSDSDEELDEQKSNSNVPVVSVPETITLDIGKKLSRESFKMEQGEVISRKALEIDQGQAISRESFNKDKGEMLSRDSFKVLMNTQSKEVQVNQQNIAKKPNDVKKEKKAAKKAAKQAAEKTKTVTEINEHSHTKVTNTDSLREFINKEEGYRNDGDNRALTEHLSLMQWHALKNILLKLCNVITNKKVDKKFQKIWKEKCLDYK